jgi:hypothetical protein
MRHHAFNGKLWQQNLMIIKQERGQAKLANQGLSF